MENNYGVHISHCCKWHGCKYGDRNCPVTNGQVTQMYLCEDCYDDLEHEELFKHVLNNVQEIKQFLKDKQNA